MNASRHNLFKTYSPLEILSYYNPLGEVSGSVINGFSYTSEHRTFFRAGLFPNGLYFDDWGSPKPFGFAYNPDKYNLFRTGEPSIPYDIEECCVSYVDTSRQCGTIEVQGGFDAYLSRLKSKKRSELKKIASRMSYKRGSELRFNYDYDNTVAVSLKSTFNTFIREKALRDYSKTFPELLNTFDTEVINFIFFKYLISLYESGVATAISDSRNDSVHRSIKSIFVLKVLKDGVHLCDTYGVVDKWNHTAYCLVDVNRSSQYLAKDACVANIMWAADNGYSYVDFNNAIQTKDTVAKEEDYYRVQYKNTMYTSIYTPTLYFSSQEDLDMYLQFKSDAEYCNEESEDSNDEREEEKTEADKT